VPQAHRASGGAAAVDIHGVRGAAGVAEALAAAARHDVAPRQPLHHLPAAAADATLQSVRRRVMRTMGGRTCMLCTASVALG